MDEKTNLTPEQNETQTGEEFSFTITGEDAAAQEALDAKKPEKKKSPLPWIIGGAAVVVAAAEKEAAKQKAAALAARKEQKEKEKKAKKEK